MEAVQWFKEGDHHLVSPIPDKYKGHVPVVDGATGMLGHTFVHPGDWIVNETENSVWAYRPDEFEREFEIVGEGS